MKKPKELIEFYDSIENIESLNIWNIQKDLKSAEKIKGEWQNKLIVERKALNFNINKGILESNAQFVDKKGILKTIEFNKKEIDYLKLRLNETSNIWLKTRYAHLLWQETKHKKYSSIAFDNYVSLINLIKPKEVRELPIILSAIVLISYKTKEKKDEVKKITIDLLEQLPIWLKINILVLILESKLFTKTDFVRISKNLINWIEQGNPASYSANKKLLELSLLVFTKVGKSTDKIFELLALNEDLILDQHPNDEDFIKYTTIGNKARYYKRAGKIDESNKLFKEYNRLKEKVKLGHFQYTLDDEHTELFNKFLNRKSEIILSLPSDSILAYFSVAEELLVDPKKNKEQAVESLKNSIYNLFSTSVFDINSNYKELKDEDKLDRQVIQNYSISHSIGVESLFIKVFTDGVISGKLNYYKVYEYLKNNTWFNLKFKRSMSLSNHDEDTSWLTFLAPGIHNLFSQFEYYVLMNTNKVNNLILALDSLTLKFEGLLRDFIRLCGGHTTTEKRGVLSEQLLEELLENEIIKKHFSEKDIILFKFCFTKKGKDIRNDVAHAFMEFSDYSLQKTLLVFFCILRISKYTFDEKTRR